MRIVACSDQLGAHLVTALTAHADAVVRAHARPCLVVDATVALGSRAVDVGRIVAAAHAIEWPVFVLSTRAKSRAGLRKLRDDLRATHGVAADRVRRCYMRPREYQDDPRAFTAAVREHIRTSFGHSLALVVGGAWSDVCADPHATAKMDAAATTNDCLVVAPDGVCDDGTPRIVFGLNLQRGTSDDALLTSRSDRSRP